MTFENTSVRIIPLHHKPQPHPLTLTTSILLPTLHTLYSNGGELQHGPIHR